MEKKITKEIIEEVLNDITPKNKDRQFKMWVMVNNKEEAEQWIKNFNDLMKQEVDKQLDNIKIKDRIKELEKFIKESGDSDPRDAYDINHWKKEIKELENEIENNNKKH